MKPQTAAHTPAPWKVREQTNGWMDIVWDRKDGLITESTIVRLSNKANAAFIVRSTNNFERMLAALKEVHWLTQGPSMEKQDAVMMQVLNAIHEAEK